MKLSWLLLNPLGAQLMVTLSKKFLAVLENYPDLMKINDSDYQARYAETLLMEKTLNIVSNSELWFEIIVMATAVNSNLLQHFKPANYTMLVKII